MPRWNIFPALLLAMLAGCSQNDSVSKEEGDEKKKVPVKTVPVTQETVERTTVQPATIHPLYQTEIRAKVSGYVDVARADEGDFAEIGDVVKSGGVLAVIEVPEMDEQRNVIEARIARLKTVQRQAEAGIDLAKADIISANAKFAQSKSEQGRVLASLAAAEAEFQRTRDLVERGSLERRVLDEVRKKRDSELAAKQSVLAAIDSAKADVTVAEAKLAAAEADLEAAKAETAVAERQRDELDVMIGYATLKAPFDGVITDRSVDPGDLIRAGDEGQKGQPLFVVSRIDKVRVRIPVPEEAAAFVNRGNSVSLSFPSFPAEEPLTGEVTRTSESLDPNTRTMLVEVEMDNPDRKLLPGMFGQASIALSTKIAANVLPARAVRFDEEGKAYVYVVGKNDTVSVIDVTMGFDDGHSIEIVSGVEAGQRVIDAHLKRFTDGQRVTVLE